MHTVCISVGCYGYFQFVFVYYTVVGKPILYWSNSILRVNICIQTTIPVTSADISLSYYMFDKHGCVPMNWSLPDDLLILPKVN